MALHKHTPKQRKVIRAKAKKQKVNRAKKRDKLPVVKKNKPGRKGRRGFNI